LGIVFPTATRTVKMRVKTALSQSSFELMAILTRDHPICWLPGRYDAISETPMSIPSIYKICKKLIISIV